MRYAAWIGTWAVFSAVLASGGAFGADGDVEGAKEIEKELVSLVGRVSKAYVMIGGGSGVVISPDGWMLTNEHVIAQQRKKKEWSVMMPIHKRFKADLIGKDVTGDIALLKIRGVSDLPFVPLGDSDALKVGHMVVALGNPYSHALRTAEPTVTYGIVSVLHRNQRTYSDAIQTDAPLNPGNSGGPLINLEGELVGINGRVLVRFGEKYNTGIGLAIPTNQISLFLPLLKKGDVWHGQITGLKFERGGDGRELVGSVRPGTVAERAGFRKGDRILEVGGRPAWNQNRFWGLVHAHPEGAKVAVKVEREGRTVEIEAKLIRWRLGGSRRLASDKLKPGLGAKMNPDPPITGGAEILEVAPNSAASKAGLEAGDIILRFNGKQVLGPGDLEAMIETVYKELDRRARRDRKVSIRFLRGLEEKEVPVTLGPKPE